MLAVAVQDSPRDAATFRQNVAEFDARALAMERAPQGEPPAAAALAAARAAGCLAGDCGNLLAGARPLREVAGAGGNASTLALVDRLIALCPR